MRRAVFLDRDGVVNRAIVRDGRPYPPSGLAELDIPADVPDGLAALRAAGFLMIVVTNQPDVARGATSSTQVEMMNDWLAARLPIDEFRVCYHDDSDGCECRKPHAGLLIEAARDHGIALAASFIIGDRWRDIEAGARAGCRTVFIDYQYDEPQPATPDVRVGSFGDAVAWILAAAGDDT